MSDRMISLPFKELLKSITAEYGATGSIFGINEKKFFRKENNHSFRIFGERCDSPAGPAAGPHTQLSRNIIASYLAGGRFMELKTVQKMDSLEFDKPCIDARDEAYNTEWSTELSLKTAWDEYVKAWIVLHLLEDLFDLGIDRKEKGFIFNMSIGYDLAGIKTEPMDRFIRGLIDASGEEAYNRYLEELSSFLASKAFRDAFGEASEKVAAVTDRISPAICRSVTLSTMHGCPPEEQESICSYLLTEKNLHTYVKLNPTLLGYRMVRESLDQRGFTYIGLKEDTFLHDLQYPDALTMLKNLRALADEKDLSFGVKLSNTLASVNPGDVLPGEEQYMAGRALFPLTVTLADRLQSDISGDLPVSFAGGVSEYNAAELFSTGIRPVTCATELLKPSGYLRLAGIARRVDQEASRETWQKETIDKKALTSLKEQMTGSYLFTKDFRGTHRAEEEKPLPLFDCAVAPCMEACPVGQHVPAYIRLSGEGRFDEALECIYNTNPLPSVTGTICDHQCMTRCSRLDYEGAVRIRDMKRIAARRGEGYSPPPPERENGHAAAVIGAGPAGLSAAFFLRRAGFKVTVFEKEASAGGVVRQVLPYFRIAAELLDRDIARIEEMGVSFRFNVGNQLTVESLKREGFEYIFVGIGAWSSRELKIPGPCKVIDSLEFLRTFKENPESLSLGKTVVVVGGGNTAMDGARAALRSPGVEQVFILYRRTEDQMPADREEYDNALADGVVFRPLLTPESCPEEGSLLCRVMTLGEPGPDGRLTPVPSDQTVLLEVDTVIAAVGETVDTAALQALGLPAKNLLKDPDTLETVVDRVYLGGDARTGPATVVKALGDGKKAAEAIIRRAGEEPPHVEPLKEAEKEALVEKIAGRRGCLYRPEMPGTDEEMTDREARRCLECDLLCNKCVEVCPNRANVAIRVRGEDFKDLFQIIHLDAFCNECGNCATFCPYEGKPYRDKMTVFASSENMKDSENPGFSYDAFGTVQVRAEKGGPVQRFSFENGRLMDADALDRRFSRVLETVINEYGYLTAAEPAKE